MTERELAKGFVPAARVTRGERVESWHFAAAAVVAPDGRLRARLGDPQITTCLRSAAKPFQALPLLIAGGEEAFELTDSDIGLICASHGGRPEHAERAASLLARGGFSADDLLCGSHDPMDGGAADELRESDQTPSPLHNNCSGKHAGMLMATKLLNWPKQGYIEIDHPLQARILDHVASCCGVPAEAIDRGIDGCSVPAFFVSIEAAARGFAALADPWAAQPAGADTEDKAVAQGLERVARAMGSAPAMVAGPGRFTTRLMAVTKGRLVAKEGAEGFYGVAVRGPEPCGLAVKIADGGERGRNAVVIELLRQLGALDDDELQQLSGDRRVELRNHRNLVVGAIEPDFELVSEPPGGLLN